MSPKQPLFEVLYRDDCLIAVNKAAGVPVVPARGGETKSLRDLLADELGLPPWVVHRIDAGTSGVVVFARDAETHRALSLMFQNRQVSKTYLAIVIGKPDPAQGTIDLGIAHHRKDPTRVVIAREKGKPSITHYRVVEEFRGWSLVEVKPATGRLHQVRVHLAAIGCPLAVDPLYGGSSGVYLSEFKRDYRLKGADEERPLLARLSLHAQTVELTHPATKGPLRFEAPLPRDFATTLKQMRKYASASDAT